MVPTGEPLQVNTHYYAIFSRAQPSDIPYTHIRGQISVIKGCKVDLQLRPEYSMFMVRLDQSRASRAVAPRLVSIY